VTTSVRFIAGGRQLAGMLAIYERWAREYATLDEPQQVFVGGWRRVWYVEPEILARADSVIAYRRTTRFGLPALDVEFLRGARRYRWVSLATSQQPAARVRAAADSAREAGFRVYTMEFDSTLARPLSPASFRLVEYGAPAGVASATAASP
jgi:hypothetical protein